MAAGGDHSVLLRNDGRAIAFGLYRGADDYGTARGLVPELPGGMCYTAVAAAETYTVLVRSDGQAFVSGGINIRQSDIPKRSKDQIKTVFYVHAVSSSNHTILLEDDGCAQAIGSNADGQCMLPALPAGRHYVDVAAGGNGRDGFHSLLVRDDGVALACGSNSRGQCNVPELPEGRRYVGAAAGGCHSILLRDDGSAVAFGGDDKGQCVVPDISDGGHYVAAAAGDGHSILVRGDGKVVAFGDNYLGQCAVPELSENVAVVAAAAGRDHSILICSDGRAVAFGTSLNKACDVPALPEGLSYVSRNDVSRFIVTVDASPPEESREELRGSEANNLTVTCCGLSGTEICLEVDGMQECLKDFRVKLAKEFGMFLFQLRIVRIDGRLLDSSEDSSLVAELLLKECSA